MKESRQHTEMNKAFEEIEQCISTLKDLASDAALLANLPDEQRIALLKIAGEISRPDRRERKKRNKTVDKTQSVGWAKRITLPNRIYKMLGCDA